MDAPAALALRVCTHFDAGAQAFGGGSGYDRNSSSGVLHDSFEHSFGASVSVNQLRQCMPSALIHSRLKRRTDR